MDYHLSIKTAFRRGKKIPSPPPQPATNTWIGLSISTLCFCLLYKLYLCGIYMGKSHAAPGFVLAGVCRHFTVLPALHWFGVYEWKTLSKNWISAAFNLQVILATWQSVIVIFMMWNIFQYGKNAHALKSRQKGTLFERHNSYETLAMWRLMKNDLARHKIFPLTVTKWSRLVIQT